jgi:hypothetical protein
LAVFALPVLTPLADAVGALNVNRVRPLYKPFSHAIKLESNWGNGSTKIEN